MGVFEQRLGMLGRCWKSQKNALEIPEKRLKAQWGQKQKGQKENYQYKLATKMAGNH